MNIKFGSIYEVREEKGIINHFEVIYQNKTFYWCKQHGTDYLKSIYKDSVISIDQFNEKFKKSGTRVIPSAFVFVPNGVKFSLERLPEAILEEQEKQYIYKLNESNKFLARAIKAISYHTKQINYYQREIERVPSTQNYLLTKIGLLRQEYKNKTGKESPNGNSVALENGDVLIIPDVSLISPPKEEC